MDYSLLNGGSAAVIFTTHLLVGTAIGIMTNNSAVAFGAGVVSHFVADAIPHTDEGFLLPERPSDEPAPRWTGPVWLMTIVDILIGTALFLWVWQALNGQASLFWGGLGALSPDLLDNVPFWQSAFRASRLGRVFHRFHANLHARLPRELWYFGLLTNLAVSGVSLVVIRALITS